MAKLKNGECLSWLNQNIKFADKKTCLIWPYGTNGCGYGRLRFDGKTQLASWVACEMVNGPKPSDRHEVAHDCGNRLCVNPNHLRWDTKKGNAADRLIHGTHNRGENHAKHKLTNEDILLIRSMCSNKSHREISKLFSISLSLVSMIKNKKRWAHI